MIIDKDVKVLLVDDFDLVRTMLKRALFQMGVESLEEAKDGEEAFQKLNKEWEAGQPFNLVFLDWNMPKMNGIELLKICRSDEKFKNLPIIMVTAEAEKESVMEALTAGANEYLVKPCSTESLAKKIKMIQTHLKPAG